MKVLISFLLMRQYASGNRRGHTAKLVVSDESDQDLSALTKLDLPLPVPGNVEGSGQQGQRRYGRRPPCPPAYLQSRPVPGPILNEHWNHAGACDDDLPGTSR